MTPEGFLLLREAEIRACVGLDREALAAVEEAFSRFARGEAILPPPIGIDVPERQAEVHVKTAYLRGAEGFAVKVASGFYQNPSLGLPASSGLMLLMSAETGRPLALLLDNAYLTEVRTALAGAIAAKHLARKRVETVGVVGAGMQARMQVQALKLVRDFRRVLVYARKRESVERYIRDLGAHGVDVVPARSVSELVRESDLVVTATPSREPLVFAEDLHPGIHVTAVGSDGPGKRELDPGALSRADRVVCDSRAQSLRIGEMQHAATDEDGRLVELGRITAGLSPGRSGEEEMTICDLTGLGIQDTAIAVLAYDKARARGLGTMVAL
jgi:ornithine cyclodeaminase